MASPPSDREVPLSAPEGPLAGPLRSRSPQDWTAPSPRAPRPQPPGPAAPRAGTPWRRDAPLAPLCPSARPGTSFPGAFATARAILFLPQTHTLPPRPPPPELPFESREPSHRAAGSSLAGGTEPGSGPGFPARSCHVADGGATPCPSAPTCSKCSGHHHHLRHPGRASRFHHHPGASGRKAVGKTRPSSHY